MKQIKQAFSYLPHHKSRIITLILINVFMAGVALIPPFILREIIDTITENQTNTDFFRPTMYLITAGLAVQVFMEMLNQIETFYARKWFRSLRYELILDSSEKLYATTQSYFQSQRVGSLLEKLDHGSDHIAQVLYIYPHRILTPVLTAIFSLGILATIDYRIGLSIFILAPIYAFFHNKNLQTYKHFNPLMRDKAETVRGLITESAYSLESTKVNATLQQTLKTSKDSLNAALNLLIQMMKKTNVFNFFSNSTRSFATTTAYAVGAYLIFYGDLSIGSLVLVSSLASNILWPLSMVMRYQLDLQETLVGIERFFDIINAPKESDNFTGEITPRKIQGAVRFDNVSFAYDEDESNVLKNINLAIEPGTTVALVGPSGSGKTTITKLLSGLYVANKGTVSIDDKPITDYDLEALRKNIAVVFQEPFVFSDTLQNNIKMVKPRATKDEVLKAIKMANMGEFIKKFPKGLRTEVGERGVKLSGGQKQRLAIAQAFLKDAQIIIFDEATSALDAESERLIQQAMRRLMKDRTTFIISHRLSTVIHADLILVIKDGKVVEQGTHKQLKKSGGLYSKLYTLQTTDPEKLKEMDLA